MTLLRCLMGFSVGGEYTGVVAYLIEGAAPHRRGLVTSLASAASEVGGLLAAAVSALTVSALAVADLDRWGWRLPFLIGATLAGAVWIARSAMEESPDFERQKASGSVPSNPLAYALNHHRKAILRGFAISALGSITYYVGITYVPAFLTGAGGMSERAALWLSTAAAVVVVFVTPLVGALSDRFGRKPVLLSVGVCSSLLPTGAFALMTHTSASVALVCAVLLAALGGAVSGVGAVATAEQFPGEGRLSGLALGATAATALFGGMTPFIAQQLIAWTDSPLAPGAMIAVVAIAVLPVLAKIPETRPE